MARLTPEEFAEKHGRRLKGAISDIQTGIQKVTEAPTAKAAAKAEKMRARINEAIDSGLWQERLRKVSVDDWKQAAITKGVGRIPAGVDAARKKVEDFAAQLLSYQDTLKKDVEKLPDLTLEDSINRMTTWVRGMAKFRKK